MFKLSRLLILAFTINSFKLNCASQTSSRQVNTRSEVVTFCDDCYPDGLRIVRDLEGRLKLERRARLGAEKKLTSYNQNIFAGVLIGLALGLAINTCWSE